MKERPDIYGGILVFGGGSPETDGPPVARIGGAWAQPNLGLSYLLAARYVIERGQEARGQNEVALPAAYLQRHAFEVALKDLIESVFTIKADTEWLAALETNARAPRPQQSEVALTHDFKKLVDLLRSALAEIGYGDIPTEVVTMASRLIDVESFKPDRLRYSKTQDGSASFPDAILVQVGETQEQLEALFKKVFVYQDDAGATQTLVTDLSHDGMALDQAILARVPIEGL